MASHHLQHTKSRLCPFRHMACARQLRQPARATTPASEQADRALLAAFGQPTPSEVVELIDKNNDGSISRDELKKFFTMCGIPGVEESPKVFADLMQEVSGDASADSLPNEKLAQWLDGKGFLEKVSEERGMIWWHGLRQEKEQSSLTGRILWPFRKIRGYYRRARVKVDPGYRSKLIDKNAKKGFEEALAAAEKRAQEVEQRARAKIVPERATEFEIIAQMPDWPEMRVKISYEDTLDDVFVRYIDALKKGEGYASPYRPTVSADELYAGIRQPDWLVVQQGDATDKRGFAVKNFDLLVSELELTSADALHFMPRSKDSLEIFFERYHRREAIATAPQPSQAKKAWDSWKEDHMDQYEALTNPNEAKGYLIGFTRKILGGFLRKSWTLDRVDELGDGQFRYVVDGTTFFRDKDGSTTSQ
eukprot:gnl/TRDRNA2_/TRDRNA2_57728_c0_seq1.p1 gnl/TRDRNA2_/TRDRNA2_57728_c0~~gnl/TRDRNA2_/TRDRNA2_57728_c0_seq1.p1  ORF type:complete len:494 (+),score=55.04 gnl/TRDRNA2_/TRDRNA2_57728_c0_seq1:225-1484(+)